VWENGNCDNYLQEIKEIADYCAELCIAVNSKGVRFLKYLVSQGHCDDVSRKLMCIFISFTSTHMTWMKEKYCAHS